MSQLNTRIVLRNDTASRWTEINPILQSGEAGIENDTLKIKVGNGINMWNDLPYVQGKANLVVVEKFSDLPEEGDGEVLYKINSTQQIYIWNALTKSYNQLGQGGGSTDVEGYTITLQNTMDSRIFVALEGDQVSIAFRYSSVDIDGMNDGPGIGNLIVNSVKKATIAVPQKLNTLDITKYLSLGENNVEIIVENSEGKTKSLTYQIEIINLSLSTNFKDMAIYSSATDFAFVIVGSGTKTIHYLMDGKEIDTEELTNTTKLAHTYKIPMQTVGDHIFQVYADMEVNNMTVTSNTLTIGMMFVSSEMVDTFILSTFTQKESAQGEVITIPYLVYNPFNETNKVYLKIYNEDGGEYFNKEIIVDQTPQNWVIQDYPAGNITLQLVAESETGTDTVKTFQMTITASTFELSPITTNLALEFSAAGRSNNEANPAQWKYGDIEATFEHFAWSVADGWVESDSGETVLRFLPKNKMIIPYQPFATDKRTTGYSIEIEMATHNVKDYDSVVLSCVDEGRGFVVKSQSVTFKSEQSEEIVMMFKEDERVRVTITIEPQTLNRFIKLYVNGVLCGVEQYTENDNFKQANPKNITIGSDTCGLDLYKLRFYDRNLGDDEQLNNFICDRSTMAERVAAQERNEIYDISGNLTIASLPATIPYIVLQTNQLPGKKEDEFICSMYYVDKLRPSRCFSANGCSLKAQGTSSMGYPIKNFKVKFKKGITYNDGGTADGFPILEDGLISTCLCLKADYASSEQANNVMLVDYYDELIRDYYLTPAQEENPKVRVGISGKPIVVFWENTTTGEIKFQGQYNMNNDKSNENVFGFDRDKWPRTECWEFSNNTSNRTLFKESEWNKTIANEDGTVSPAWMSDFEARFPDTKPAYSDYTQFKRFCDFVVSTDRRQATNEAFEGPVTFGEKDPNTEELIYYNADTVEYRLAKFKNEFENYAIKDTFIFYYLFTETFLMIDSRAKNLFLTTYDGTHWFPIPYDFDTAIGINNEGALVFDYDLEDTDVIDGENVFNGQESTLWLNVRDAFKTDLFALYKELRKNRKFAYDVIVKKMNDHQSVWPEAIWNEDAKVKYLDIFLTEGEKYFEMCQGNKAAQRDWWLFNGFKYRDSKYQCGDSEEFSAFFRAYAPADMTVTPYQHLWPRVDYTDTYPVTQRSKRNVENLLKCPIDTASDSEIWLRSADRISSFGDLSKYQADTVKFASATKLQDLILGGNEEGYKNHNLTSVELGNNRLISYLNVENCTKLVQPINLSNCYNMDTIKAKGSGLNSITFPVGGHLTTLELPGTFTNLTLRNQHNIENFSMESYELINTIWIDDTPGLPIEEILLNTPKLDRVRIVNTTWNVSNEETLRTIFEKLKICGGLDANGNNTADGKAVVTGFVNINSISDELLEELNELFPELIVIVDGKAKFFIRYFNQDGTLLYKYVASSGEDAINPIIEKLIEVPSMPAKEDTLQNFAGWSSLPTNIQGPKNIVALYNFIYRVQFFDGDNNVIHTEWVPAGQGIEDPINKLAEIPTKTSTAQYNYVYSSWEQDFNIISAPLNVYAIFTSILRDYEVIFMNGNTELQRSRVYYGAYASYEGDESQLKKIVVGQPSDYYEFSGWNPDISTPITGTKTFYADYVFDGYIDESWDEIAENIKLGKKDLYNYGGIKMDTITYTSNNKVYTQEVAFEIIGRDHNELENVDPSYNNGATTAGLTFRGLLKTARIINSGSKPWQDYASLNGGGWAKSDLRAWLNTGHNSECFFNDLPEDLRRNIKSVKILSDNGYHDYPNHGNPNFTESLTETSDKIFLASAEELNTYNSAYTLQGQGSPYPLFTDANSRKIDDLSYWTRSTAGKTSIHGFCMITGDGYLTDTGAGNLNYIVVYFCI